MLFIKSRKLISTHSLLRAGFFQIFLHVESVEQVSPLQCYCGELHRLTPLTEAALEPLGNSACSRCIVLSTYYWTRFGIFEGFFFLSVFLGDIGVQSFVMPWFL